MKFNLAEPGFELRSKHYESDALPIWLLRTDSLLDETVTYNVNGKVPYLVLNYYHLTHKT
jgi:hypothetical protein